MQYLGGKYRIRKKLGAFLTEQAKGKAFFLDMFCGAGNVVANVSHPRRYANDGNRYIIAVLKRAQAGGEFPSAVTAEDHREVKNNREKFPDWLVGFVGFGCSFGGDFNGGYARSNRDENFAGAAANSLKAIRPNIQDVRFSCNLFSDIAPELDDESGLIYCDPPYEGTTGYSVAFDREQFYQWAKAQAQWHTVLVSEYEHNARGPILWLLESKKELRNAAGVRVPTREVVFQVLP